MAIKWTPTGGRKWTDMTRAEFDLSAELVLFEKAEARGEVYGRVTAASEPDLFSLDEPDDQCE
jgi:hypothetical protein